MLGFALPDYYNTPATALERRPYSPIPHPVALKFRLPKGTMSFRQRAALTAMAVPETSVHKYHGAMAQQNQVRRPGQIASMKAKAKPEFMRDGTYQTLRSRVLAAD
jgi:hypothetical protein